MQKFVQRRSNLGPPGSGKAEGGTFGPYVEKTLARVNKHSEKLVLFCFLNSFTKQVFFFPPQGVFNLGLHKFFVLPVFKNGRKKKYIIIYSPCLLIVLPSCLCSFSRQALLCHSRYLETWGCKHVSFYLIRCFFFSSPFYHSEDLWC